MKQFCKKGFSTIEILLAGAVFILFAWGVIEMLITALKIEQQGQEIVIASGFATEGIEALRSLKEKNFDDLTVTTSTGIERQAEVWVLAGENNTLQGKYRRTLSIQSVNRDENGVIVEDGGSEDGDTRRATVTVEWDAAPSRTNSVVFQTYFTRWHP